MTRILIVDDEPDIVESLDVMLAKKGYEILSAASGDEGIAVAEREKPDVILLDVMMPVLNGFDACRRLKASPITRNIPVLILTALNQVDDKVKGLEAGADDFVTKPFNDAELRARVEAFLRTKQLRDELERSYEKLKELEQMRDALTGMIVHDLKAPLTAITGGLTVVIDHFSNDRNVADQLKKIAINAHSSSKRLVAMIEDILDVSRMEQATLPIRKVPADLADLAQTVVHALKPAAAQAHVALSFQFSGGPVRASVDTALIERVFSNLISNSMKFTDAGGSVLVSARVVPTGNQAEVSVEDTGIGIPKEHLGKIFEKFFQSGGHEVTRKGQGLGLSFCRMVVESHGGRIWAESEPGKGSRFIVRVPVE